MNGTIKGPSPMGGSITRKKSGRGDLDKLLTRGYSAYDVAVINGFVGSESEWLESLKSGSIQLKVDENDIMWWKYPDDEVWMQLLNLGVIINNRVEAAAIEMSTVRLLDALPETPKKNIMYIVKE